ncbi:MAG: signal peptidase I [Clostridia bacterium]|nr:signal peptidase I [Clostridia bacterium]
MNKDKKIIYTLSIAAFAVLLVIFSVTARNSAIITAITMTIITPAVSILIKKRSSLSINKKEVMLLTTIVAALYVVLMLVAGLSFVSYKNPYFVNTERLLTLIIPSVVIIITSEIIRYVLLNQKNKLANILSWLICVLAEILIFSGISEFENFNHFMDLVGMTLFPAITANVYYHYVSKRFGALPNISFRLICTLYVYFIPVYSEIPSALHACIKTLLPLVILALTSALFEKKKRNAIVKGKKASLISMVVAVVVVVSTAMLISCQFRFGAIVVATESMTGEINKGDMIIYERYDGQTIKEGQVIVFLQYENRIIHRVIKIEHIGNEVRYYTKGDANEEQDQGYITDADIVGLTDMKISYVGFPTLWLRELLEGGD